MTLIEVLVTLAIIALLSAISLPILRGFLEQREEDILKSQLLNAIDLAHFLAQVHHVPVGLCKSTDHTTCKGQWADGQLVFWDEYADGVIHDKDQVFAVIKTSAFAGHGTLFWDGFPSYRDYLLFRPTALLPTDNGTFWYCQRNDKTPVFAIMLSKSGRARVLARDSQGRIKNSQGKSLCCEGNAQ